MIYFRYFKDAVKHAKDGQSIWYDKAKNAYYIL